MNPIEKKEEIKVTLRDFIKKYSRYIPLFIITVCISLVIAYLYLRYATPIYNARATMLIKDEKNPYAAPNEEFESIFLYKGGSDVDNEIEVLKSNNIAKRVSKSLGLQVMYYAVGNIKTSLLYPARPFELRILKIYDTSENAMLNIKLKNSNEFTVGENSPTYSINQRFKTTGGEFILRKLDSGFNTLQYKEYVVEINTEASAASIILNGTKVSPIKDRSNVLLLSYEGIHPELGKDILNNLMEEYKNLSIEDKNQIAIQTNNFINKRLDIIASELGDVEKTLQQYKTKNQVINLGVQSDLFLTNQSDFEKELEKTEIQLNILKYLEEYLVNKENSFNIVPSSLGIEDPVFMQMVKAYNEMQLKREGELKTTTANNPVIINLEIQLEKLRVDMQENIKNLASSALLVRSKIRQKINQYNSTINNIPGKERSLLDITRQQGIKQSLYLYLLQKREETAISLASTISNSQVLDSATSSNKPIKPAPQSIKVIAIFLGLLFPAIYIYLRELLNDKISNRHDINKHTQAPIFGEIAHSDETASLVVKSTSRNVISEQFRMIRTNLQYLIGGKDKSVILVTSTFSGEGKSFVSINMGAVMALAGKKTVILEFDIRKPKILSGLEMSKSPGITNYVVGGQPLESLPVKVPNIDNLYVIPCGAIPPNPAELLLEEKLSELFEYAKNNFDIVIVDTAPVGLVSDAQILSKHADCTFYIVRLNYTLKKHVHFINDLYLDPKLPKIALLINDIKAGSTYYSYGNYAGYGYGYGYNYLDDSGRYSKNAFIRFFQKKFGSS